MHSGSSVVGVGIATVGAPSLTQGVYGARGNLELVACDEADGLWVFWYNADLETDPLAAPDVPPGSWSAGMTFAPGARYIDAQILQSTLGPDHLEVLALDERGALQSWYWSPDPGFQRRAQDAATAVSRFATVHDRGTVRVTVEEASGSILHLESPPRGYPFRVWRAAITGPSLEVDAEAVVGATGAAASGIIAGTSRAAPSTRNGGTVELTWRDTDGAIRHLGVPFV